MSAFQEELDSRDTLYLVDGESPTLVEAWTIAVVSPERRHYWSYYKEPGVMTRYMPVWSEEELLDAQKGMYTHLEEELVKTLYEKWAGSALYCLQWAKNVDSQRELQRVVDAIDLGAWSSLGNIEDMSAPSSRICPFSVSDDYSSAEVVFASRYVERLVMSAFMRRRPTELMQELASWMGEEARALFVEAAFEEMFHNAMEGGCRLECRDLETKDAEPFTQHFEKCVTHMFLNKEDVRSNVAANYLIPTLRTFAAVAILQPNSLFQVTTAESHKVLDTGLDAALQLLPKSSEYKL
ncbi:g2192 [Coccomyxa elongata]